MPQPTDKSSNLQPNEPQQPQVLQRGELASETKQPANNSHKVFFRIPLAYTPFFQAMAEDYYQKGKISKPSIGLLTKKCLIMAGNSWNRMMLQLNNVDYERQELEHERRRNLTTTREYQEQDRDLRLELDLKKARIISQHFKDEF